MLGVKSLLVLIVLIACSCRGSCCTSNCNNSEHPSSHTVDRTSPPVDDSNTHYMIVIVSVSCAVVILFGLLSVITLSAILAVNSNKKKEEKLSCEAIAAQKNNNNTKTLEDDGGKKKKGKEIEDKWFDDIVSPPLPPRTAEMFIFESLPSSTESCSSSSTVTVTVDIEETSDSSGSDIFEGGFHPKAVQTPFCVDTDKHQPCDTFPKPNLSNNSDFQNPKGTYSYKNVHKNGVTQYENITVVESHESATPLRPPPIPPRPHSNHIHTNHTKAPPIVCYSQSAPITSCTSSTVIDDELPEADRYDRGINLGYSDAKCDGDTTSEESLDMWPPLIPQQTQEMFILLQKDEEVEAVDKYSIEMMENVAYKTVKGGNLYVLQQRDH